MQASMVLANPALDANTVLDCGSEAAGTEDAAAATALAGAGYSCTKLFNKPTIDSATPQQVGQLWFRLTGSILQMRVLFFGGPNADTTDAKVCLDDDTDPINTVNTPGGPKAASCVGNEAANSASQGVNNGPSYPPAKAANVAPEEAAGKFELKVDLNAPINPDETWGGSSVGGWNVNIDGYTEVVLHFNLGAFSILAYFQPEVVPVPASHITIEADDVNRVGDSHTFTIRTFHDPDTNTPPGAAPTDAAAVTVTFTGDADNVVDNCANGTGDAGDVPSEAVGVCTVTFDSDTPGLVTANAAATVGGIAVETDGTGNNSDDAIKRFVDARISIDPDATNQIGESHTFTVLVEANDGSGWAAVDVTAVTVTLTAASGAVVSGLDDDCANGTGGLDDAGVGMCDVTFTSNTPGTVTGNASATVSLTTTQGNINLPVSTADTNSPTGAAIKTFEGAATLQTRQRWLPNDAAQITGPAVATLSGDVVFTLYNDGSCGDDGGTAQYTETIDVTTGTGTANNRRVSTSNSTFHVTANNDGTAWSWLVSYDDDTIDDPANECETTTPAFTLND